MRGEVGRFVRVHNRGILLTLSADVLRQVMALGNGMPGGNGALSDPMQAAVAEQLTNWKPDSLAFKLFSEIANARGPSFLQPAFPDMLDDTEESDES